MSRTEPKDYIDLYFIIRKAPSIAISEIYEAARKKEGIFDDPPTVAYQIEQGLEFLKAHRELFPRLNETLDEGDFFSFYADICKWVYDRFDPGAGNNA